MSRRLFFTRNRPANVDNHYVVGSGVGSKSRFVRSALRRRSSNNAQGKPCCFPMPKTMDEISATVEEKNNCTGGMVWKECGSACTRTCSDPKPVCTKQCVPKCECPEGQVLENGQCVDVNTCNLEERQINKCVNSNAQGHCAKIDDANMVKNWNTLIAHDWEHEDVLAAFGIPNAQVNGLFSALDAAKAWILTTDGEDGPPGGGPYNRGGCLSCSAAVAVALQEGGNQVGPGAMTPAMDVPSIATDPTFSTKSGCLQTDKCQSGGFWQVSNAWVGDKCSACDAAGCHSLENPLCTARIALQWTQGLDTNKPCTDQSGNLNICSAQDLQSGPDPNCMLGPFCLGSDGWNSPPCSQMYRQTDAVPQYLPYCRIAINACAMAVEQLEAAGWKTKDAGSCEPEAMKNVVDIACAGHTTGGNWQTPTATHSTCTCDGKACLNADQTYGCSGETCVQLAGTQTQQDCIKICKPSKPSYYCDISTSACLSGHPGPFTTKTDCEKICVKEDISQCKTYGDYLPYSRNNSTNKFCCKQKDYHFDTDISGSGCNATASACYLNNKPSALCPGTDMPQCYSQD